MKEDIIALVGAGKGGKAILSTLLKIPGVLVKYVIDFRDDAPGLALARKHGIECVENGDLSVISEDHEIGLILEVTGDHEVFDKLMHIKRRGVPLIGSTGSRIIFHLLDAQNMVTQDLKELKRTLELRIIARTKEIEDANRKLQAKIVEYERLNEKLQQINDEKTKYLLQATHQLKAPFAAIQSYTDIILDGYTGDITEQTRDVMSKIKRRCGLLANSIKEMLQLANLKSCVTDNLKVEKLDINQIIKEVVDQIQPVAEARAISIGLEIHPEGCLIQASADQMRILFSVLIENAINYSHNESEIWIRIMGHKDGLAIVSIQDNGIGISPLQVGKIFNEYYRTNEAARHHEDGTGLGLSIAREIAQLHNGSIAVRSDIDKGSTFTVTLMGFNQ